MITHQLSDDVYVFSGDFFERNCGVIFARKQACLIDAPLTRESCQQISDLLAKRQASLTYLINTHYHWDHALGDWFFRDVPVIAHKAWRRMAVSHMIPYARTMKKTYKDLWDAEIISPTIVVNESYELQLGDEYLELIWLPGHTPDSIAVRHSRMGLIFAGDAVMEGHINVIRDGRLKDFFASLERLRGMVVHTVVPGHGYICDLSIVDKEAAYFRYLHRQVSEMVHRKRSLEEVLTLPLVYPSRMPENAANMVHRQNLVRVYKDLVDGSYPLSDRQDERE
ncbi:MAG: MBL fold metallo-hydrolase [Chloroflexi bacterium]|nr:MBL fold metallo-hydrolase [Chloroflexota bacterium]MCL5075375.1 MBL fold metallo-hydrolase [Chloroflexota bacterium]